MWNEITYPFPIVLHPPVWWTRIGICCIEGPGVFSTQSVEVRASGGTTSVYFGIIYVCFSPCIFAIFALGPSTGINFLFMWKTSFEGKNKILEKIPCRFTTWMGFVGQIFIKIDTSSIQGFLQLPLWCPLRSNLHKHAGGYPVTTEACISLAGVFVVWRSGSSLDLSVLSPEPIFKYMGQQMSGTDSLSC